MFFWTHVDVYRLIQQDLAGASWHLFDLERYLTALHKFPSNLASIYCFDWNEGFVRWNNMLTFSTKAPAFFSSAVFSSSYPSNDSSSLWLWAGHIFGSWRSRWNWVLASDGWLGRTTGVAPLIKLCLGKKHANFGPLHGRVIWGMLFQRWAGFCLICLENGWYHILSFEGCNNGVKFGFDCLIIDVCQWCKNFSSYST